MTYIEPIVDEINHLRMELAEKRAKVIEECARAVENAAINEANAGYYAKVIRALKEKL